MKKIIYLLLFTFFLISNVYSETIKDIEIKGNERISKKTIILFSGIQLNQEADSNELNQIIKRLYKTNFFENVQVSIENSKLKIIVSENPVVQTLQFNGIKKKSIIEILKEHIALKEKNSFIKNLVKIDETKIINILKANGYYFAEVNSKIKENDNNTVDLIYDINLGNRAHIKKIKFIGDKKIKDRKLKSVIVSEESKFWKFISNRKYLDVNRIKLDENLLKNYYKNNGYFNVVVNSSSAQIINKTDFELIFNINAGNKYFFNNFNLIIPDEYTMNNFNNILNLFEDLKGKVYSLRKVEEILDEIDKIALTKEFEFINAKYNETLDGNKLNLEIILEESDKYYVEKINIFGNFITDEKVIRNSLIVDEGDAYNDILINKSVNEIQARQIFKSVTKNIKEGSNPKYKVIDITVEERPTGELTAGAGTGTSGSTVFFGIKEKNFTGAGVKVAANLSLSDDGLRGLFSIDNPNFNNSDRSLKTSIESTSNDKMSKFGYKSSKTGFSLGTTYEQFRDIYFSPSASLYYESIETSSSATAARKKQEGNYLDANFSYGLILNKLNRNFQPTDGYKSVFFQTLPIYSEDFTLTNQYEFSKYFSLKDDYIFSLGVFVKSVNSISGDDVRASKRIFLPSNKMRGFEIGKIGPLDSGDFIGGNFGSTVNVATTMPKLFPQLQNLDFSIFLDAGNVWGVDYNSSLDNSKIRTATGIAVDWFTPIGPLSFSFAKPITKAGSDITETFRFNIGTTF